MRQVPCVVSILIIIWHRNVGTQVPEGGGYDSDMNVAFVVVSDFFQAAANTTEVV